MLLNPSINISDYDTHFYLSVPLGTLLNCFVALWFSGTQKTHSLYSSSFVVRDLDFNKSHKECPFELLA